MNRKERETAFRRQAILDAAREIFETDGYTSATMAQIASRAEFGVGTLYRFFPSKQSLFAEVILQGMDRFRKGLKKSVADKASWQDELTSSVEYLLTWIETNPAFHRLIYEIFYAPIPDLTPRIFDVFKDTHRETMEHTRTIFYHANKAGARFDADLMSLVILGMIHAIGDNCFLDMLSKPPTGYIPGIIGVVLGGKTGE